MSEGLNAKLDSLIKAVEDGTEATKENGRKIDSVWKELFIWSFKALLTTVVLIAVGRESISFVTQIVENMNKGGSAHAQQR